MDNVTLAYSMLNKVEHDYLQLQADVKAARECIDNLVIELATLRGVLGQGEEDFNE